MRRHRDRSKLRRALLKAALGYADGGWAVFPLEGKKPYPGTHGFKDATTDEKQIRAWWKKWPEANVGISCNSESGPIVLDVDGPSGAALIDKLELPATRTAQSQPGRRHYYFSPLEDGTAIKRTIRLHGKSLDILGDGGHVVAPPSIHPGTGKPYEWVKSGVLVPLPRAVLELWDRAPGDKQVGPIPDLILEGQRDVVLTSLAGSMRRRGASERAILVALRTENASRVVPPLPDADLARIARSIAAKPVGGGWAKEVVTIRLSRVKPEKVTWLAEGVLPFGKFALIEGDPGQGKSTLTLHIASSVTRGTSVLGTKPQQPRNVILLTYEDALADTVRPRVDALGGDPSRITVFRGIRKPGDSSSERPPILPEDIRELRRLIKKRRAALVIVDPLGAALSEATDSHNDASVRRVTARLAELAEKTGASILGVRHLVKGAATNAVRAGGGSIAFAAAARVLHVVGEHPEDSGLPHADRRRVFATVKNNLGPMMRSKLFRIVASSKDAQPTIEWVGETTLSAEDLNSARISNDSEARSSNAEIDAWLRQRLAGKPVPAKEVFREGLDEGGWTQKQLRRAFRRIGGTAKRDGYGRGAKYVWSLDRPKSKKKDVVDLS